MSVIEIYRKLTITRDKAMRGSVVTLELCQQIEVGLSRYRVNHSFMLGRVHSAPVGTDDVLSPTKSPSRYRRQ
jgi:hypothetical protein